MGQATNTDIHVAKSKSKIEGGNMFWGVLFLTVGLAIILSYVFKVDLPIARMLVSFFFIYMGFKILFGSFGLTFSPKVTDNAAVFGSGQFNWDASDYSYEDSDVKKFDVVFGSGDVDLTDVVLDKGNVNVKVDSVFAETKVRVRKGTPYTVISTTAFAQSVLPNKDSTAFGKMTYDSKEDGPHRLIIKADVVFGKLSVIEE